MRDRAPPARLEREPARGLAGTPLYLPPEVAAGTLTGYAADVYGLGAILYTLLARRRPYTDTEPWDISSTVMGTLDDPCEYGTVNLRLKWLTTPSLDPIYSAWPTTIPADECE